MLEPLGLDDCEEQVYRVLMSQTAPATVIQLAQDTGLPPGRVRRALTALADAGLAVRPVVQSGAQAYAAVDPRVGLSGLLHTRRRELEDAATAVEAYAAEFHERRLRADPNRLVEVVEGPSAITARMEELMAGAEREVLAFDSPPYVTADNTASRSERALLARGVRVRAVYASDVLAIPERAERLQDLVALGEHARVLPHVPLKMVVFDRRDAVIPLTASEEGTRSTAALIRRSRLCDALVELFEAHWAQAIPVFGGQAAHQSRHEEIDESDRALLHLLHAGLKDDAVARHLDISERTLRRRISDLLDRLGASSRFQAGAQAVRRGWI